jgi:hypothetical protein
MSVTRVDIEESIGNSETAEPESDAEEAEVVGRGGWAKVQQREKSVFVAVRKCLLLC